MRLTRRCRRTGCLAAEVAQRRAGPGDLEAVRFGEHAIVGRREPASIADLLVTTLNVEPGE